MLRFSDRQLAALVMPGDAAVVRRVRNAAIRRHGRAIAGMSDARLEAVIAAGVARGRDWGLAQGDSLMLFVLLMLEISPGFDREARIAGYLAAAGDRDAAMLEICAAVPAEAWAAASGFDGAEEWVRTTRARP